MAHIDVANSDAHRLGVWTDALESALEQGDTKSAEKVARWLIDDLRYVLYGKGEPSWKGMARALLESDLSTVSTAAMNVPD